MAGVQRDGQPLVQPHEQLHEEPQEEPQDEPHDEDVDPSHWPERHALAAMWEEELLVRNQVRGYKKLLMWPKPQLIGVASLQALALNKAPVFEAMHLWSHHSGLAKSPPVRWLKQEAWGVLKCFLFVR